MLRNFLALAFIFMVVAAPVTLAAFDEKPAVESLRRDFENGNRIDLARRTDAAMDAALTLAIGTLREEAGKLDDEADRYQRRGALADAYTLRSKAGEMRALAEDVEAEWRGTYAGLVVQIAQILEAAGPAQDVPELYEPMSQWLRLRLNQIEAAIGTQLYNVLHLDDLQTINEGTPFALRLKKYMGENVPTMATYALYFDPWAGVIAYWTTWGVCVAATWGGGVAFICTPAAMLAEKVVRDNLAPRWDDRIYARLYQ